MSVSPHPEFDRILEAMKGCRAVPWDGIAYRCTPKRYAFTLKVIDGLGSLERGGRWNPPEAFRVVYTSLDEWTALCEVIGKYGHYNIPPSAARPEPEVRVITPIGFQLQSILPLTDPEILSILGLTIERLVYEPWQKIQKSGREAITQATGRAAWALGFEGILAPSAVLDHGVNLAVFNDFVPFERMKIFGS